jgi:hypothetical protein
MPAQPATTAGAVPQPGTARPVPGTPPAKRGAPTQQAYDLVMYAAAKAIYSPQTKPQILAMIKAARNPVDGLLQVTALIMRQLDEVSKKSMPSEVRAPATKEVMSLIAELAEANGVITDADAVLEHATQEVDRKTAGMPQGNFKSFLAGADADAQQPGTSG